MFYCIIIIIILKLTDEEFIGLREVVEGPELVKLSGPTVMSCAFVWECNLIDKVLVVFCCVR